MTRPPSFVQALAALHDFIADMTIDYHEWMAGATELAEELELAIAETERESGPEDDA